MCLTLRFRPSPVNKEALNWASVCLAAPRLVSWRHNVSRVSFLLNFQTNTYNEYPCIRKKGRKKTCFSLRNADGAFVLQLLTHVWFNCFSTLLCHNSEKPRSDGQCRKLKGKYCYSDSQARRQGWPDPCSQGWLSHGFKGAGNGASGNCTLFASVHLAFGRTETFF